MAADDGNNLFRRSYTRGLFVFAYGLIWLAALGFGFRQIEQLFGPDETTTTILLAASAASGSAARSSAGAGHPPSSRQVSPRLAATFRRRSPVRERSGTW